MPQGEGRDRSVSPASRCRARRSTRCSYRCGAARASPAIIAGVARSLPSGGDAARDHRAHDCATLKEIHRSAEDWTRLHAVTQRLVILLQAAWEERRRPRPGSGAARRGEGGGRRPVELPRARCRTQATRSPSTSACSSSSRRPVAPALNRRRHAHLLGPAMGLTPSQRRILNWSLRGRRDRPALAARAGADAFRDRRHPSLPRSPGGRAARRAPGAAPARGGAGRDRLAGSRSPRSRPPDRADPAKEPTAAQRAAAASWSSGFNRAVSPWLRQMGINISLDPPTCASS